MQVLQPQSDRCLHLLNPIPGLRPREHVGVQAESRVWVSGVQPQSDPTEWVAFHSARCREPPVALSARPQGLESPARQLCVVRTTHLFCGWQCPDPGWDAGPRELDAPAPSNHATSPGVLHGAISMSLAAQAKDTRLSQ